MSSPFSSCWDGGADGDEDEDEEVLNDDDDDGGDDKDGNAAYEHEHPLSSTHEMTLIDVWAALTEGYLPTNRQLADFITHNDDAAAADGWHFDRLSPSGIALGKRVTELRRLLAELILHRNRREEIQAIVWQLQLDAARHALDAEDAQGNPAAAALKTSTAKKAKAKGRGKQDGPGNAPAKASEALRHLRTIARIVLVQPQIRYVVSDAIALLAQIAATTAEEVVPIAQGQLEQVPSEAPKVQVVSANESESNPSASTEQGEQAAQQVAQQLAAPEVGATGANGYARLTPDLVSQVIQNPNLKLKVPLTTSTLADAAQMAGVARSKLHVVDKSTVAELGRKLGKDVKTNTAELWESEGKLRAVERLRKLCVDLQRSKGYLEAAEFFLNEATLALQKSADGISKAQRGTARMQGKVFDSVLDLLENFGGEGSARRILNQIQTILIKANEDEDARRFFADLNTFINRALLEELYATTKEAETDAKALHVRFSVLSQELREDMLVLLSQVVDFATKLAQDEYLDAFVKELHALALTFAKTSKGQWGFNAELWQDVTLVILPTLVARLGVLPIPRIMYSHPDFDFVVEHVAVELRNLVPKFLDVSMTNDIHFDFHSIKSSAHSHLVKIKVRGMSLRVHRFAFAFTAKKKVKFHDHGIADLKVGGFGLSITLEIPRDRKGHYFFVKKCKAKLDELKFYIRKSNHRILHAMTSGITNSFPTRKILSLIIGHGIGLGLKQLDLALMEARLQREEEARKGIERKTEISIDDLRSRADAIRDLMRKYNESAGTFRIDFSPSDDPTNSKKWEDAHAVRWIKETLERTGAREERVWEWRSSAFGEGDPTLAVKGLPRPEGHAARVAVRAERGVTAGGGGAEASTSSAQAVDKAKPGSTAGVSAPGAGAGPGTQAPSTLSKAQEEDQREDEAIATAEQDLAALERTTRTQAQTASTSAGNGDGNPAMESSAGQAAVRRHSDVSDQVKDLEKVVNQQEARAAAATAAAETETDAQASS